MSQHNSEKDFTTKLATYFIGVKNEWSKVSWPTKKQVIGETVVVIIVVAFFTVTIFLMDIAFKFI